MLAQLSATVPPGRWHAEIKYDGYRAIAIVGGRSARLWSRNRNRLEYPEIEDALQRLGLGRAVLDGEVVALDAKGRTRFQLLQGVERGERPPLRYYVFDLLRDGATSLLSEPIERRRARLERLLRGASGMVLLSPAFDVSPAKLLAECRRKGLEGIILKRAGSRYEAGRRSGAWLKLKPVAEQEFVIGGFSPPRRGRRHFGAIAVGTYERGRLWYAGKVGSGFSHELLASLHADFLARQVEVCPFANLPLPHRPRFGAGMTRSAMEEMTWIRPELVAQVRFAEWTREGLLRHPVFVGLRRDKPPREVKRERAR